MNQLAVYTGLLVTSLAAATIFPFQSEAVLAGLLLQNKYAWGLLIAVASVGNVIGSVMNWCLGRYLNHFRDRKWFPLKAEKLQRFEACYHRYGCWSLLLSWAPVIGDPLTVVAGVLKEPLHKFLILVSIAKVARYLVVAALVQGWM